MGFCEAKTKQPKQTEFLQNKKRFRRPPDSRRTDTGYTIKPSPSFFTDNPTAMQSQELEDLTLLLVRDADEAEMWIDRWAVSYPTVRTTAASRSQSIDEWQRRIQAAWEQIHSQNVAVVAHGAGVSCLLYTSPSPRDS